MSHSTSAAGLSTRSGATTGQSDYLSAAPSASGSLPSEVGRAPVAERPSAAKPAAGGEDVPMAQASAAPDAAGDTQEAPPGGEDSAGGPPVREAAASAEVADSGAADQPAQSGPSAQQDGEEPAAASAADEEGTDAGTAFEEEGRGRAIGGQVPQESQRAEGSEGSGLEGETGAEMANGVEAEHSPEWQRQPKHVFVLTSAGERV